MKTAFSGSAPLPVELYNRFEKATGVTIIEGYGLTEATCLVSCNPLDGEKKIGSVGIPFPYTNVRILRHDHGRGARMRRGRGRRDLRATAPASIPGSTYTEVDEEPTACSTTTSILRTGDLGRIDADGYIWITGRAKDLIIRGGHNIDPAADRGGAGGHEAVALAGAIGQPDAHAGELPCAYVELVEGARVTEEELLDFARRAHHRAGGPAEARRDPRRAAQDGGRQGLQAGPAEARRSPASTTPRWPRPGCRPA